MGLAGVRLAPLDDSVRSRLGLSNDLEGVVITEIEPGSKAEDAGLVPGTVITEVNRMAVGTPKEAYSAAKENRGRKADVTKNHRRTNETICCDWLVLHKERRACPVLSRGARVLSMYMSSARWRLLLRVSDWSQRSLACSLINLETTVSRALKALSPP